MVVVAKGKIICSFFCVLCNFLLSFLRPPLSFSGSSHGGFVCTPVSESRNHPIRPMVITVYAFSLLISKKCSGLDKLPDKSNFWKKGFVCLSASSFGSTRHYGGQVIGAGVRANWLVGKYSQEAEMNADTHRDSRCIGVKA